MKENERLSYEYTLNQAILNKDKKAEKQLKDIGEDYFNRPGWLKFLEVNLFKTATQFEIPIYFIEGRYDYNAPTVLVNQYYERIKAPKKELIWFEKSAHFPQWEEPKRFHTILRDKILKESYISQHSASNILRPSALW
ncbi:MAG TPA: alpha/beta hydrolase [Epulopiscium sp.]|nr:alpha/beta hydrolase [Candidatus Epulonipiscium sp.]